MDEKRRKTTMSTPVEQPKIADSIIELIGRTPMVRLGKLAKLTRGDKGELETTYNEALSGYGDAAQESLAAAEKAVTNLAELIVALADTEVPKHLDSLGMRSAAMTIYQRATQLQETLERCVRVAEDRFHDFINDAAATPRTQESDDE